MPPKKKRELPKARIRNLGLGAIFEIRTPDDRLEHWKIVGRPSKQGKEDGKDAYYVHCAYVSQGEGDVTTSPEKYFNITREVAVIRGATKDFQAIDRRDQPSVKDQISSIDDLIKETQFEEGEGDSIEDLIK